MDVEAGACFGFLGPNGAGKTSTMRMLSCLAPRDGGELCVLGLDPGRSPRELKRMLGVVAQETTLDLELTVRENLLVFARYFSIGREEAGRRADELLALMALADRRDAEVAHLSGGMRRRLQIARALINHPRLVLLDEPTTGLDPQARHAVWERLRLMREGGATLILTTHYMDEAAQLCDRLVIMDHGRIVRAGAPAELVASETGPQVLEVRVEPADVPRALDTVAGLIRGHESDADLLILFGEDAEDLHARLRAAGVPAALHAARPATLEDVFLRLTGRHLRD